MHQGKTESSEVVLKRRKQVRDRVAQKPWVKTWDMLRYRCNGKNCTQYRWYGARGIKALITQDELKEIWFRDKAYEMKKPSIDRIDVDGHYEFKNCRYLEMSANSLNRKIITRTHCKNGHEFNLKNTYVRMRNGYANRVCRICKKWRRTNGYTRQGGLPEAVNAHAQNS